MHNVDNPNQLTSILQQERAVVFLWVEWAIHAQHSAKAAERVVDLWNLQYAELPVVLSRIDASEQIGDVWEALTEWLTTQDIPEATGLLFRGTGPIMWIRSGRIADYVVDPSAADVGDLLNNMIHSFLPNNHEHQSDEPI